MLMLNNMKNIVVTITKYYYIIQSINMKQVCAAILLL